MRYAKFSTSSEAAEAVFCQWTARVLKKTLKIESSSHETSVPVSLPPFQRPTQGTTKTIVVTKRHPKFRSDTETSDFVKRYTQHRQRTIINIGKNRGEHNISHLSVQSKQAACGQTDTGSNKVQNANHLVYLRMGLWTDVKIITGPDNYVRDVKWFPRSAVVCYQSTDVIEISSRDRVLWGG